MIDVQLFLGDSISAERSPLNDSRLFPLGDLQSIATPFIELPNLFLSGDALRQQSLQLAV